MNYSRPSLQHLTEAFESCRLVAYPDSKGIPTIGWGHTRNVRLGMTCTQQQADEWLMDEVQIAATAVSTMVHVPLTQDEFDALTDFCYNAGNHAFFCSTMRTRLNKSDYQGAADEFLKWDMCGGKHLAGLLRRRVAERTEFLRGAIL